MSKLGLGKSQHKIEFFFCFLILSSSARWLFLHHSGDGDGGGLFFWLVFSMTDLMIEWIGGDGDDDAAAGNADDDHSLTVAIFYPIFCSLLKKKQPLAAKHI